MKKLFLVAALAFSSPALAQQVPLGQIPIGRGVGVQGFNSVIPNSIPYTAPGTGGQVRAISQHLQKHLWADEYGAVCDSTTDDRVAFQNMVNAAGSLGTVSGFVGSCYISDSITMNGAVNFAKGGIFEGTGWGSSQLVFPPGKTAIAVSGTGSVTLRKFGLVQPVQAPCGATAATGIPGITVSNMTGTNVIEDIQSSCVGPVIAYNTASQSTLSRGRFANGPNGTFNVTYGTGYNGDSVVENTVLGGSTTGGGIYCNACAGLRVINNKWQSGGMAYGFFMDNTYEDGDLFFTGNSMEGITGTAIHLQRAAGSGTSHKFGVISIVGNEITGSYGVRAPTDPTAAWLHTVTISGNTIVTTAGGVGAVAIDSTNNLIVSGNSILCSGGGLGIASGSSNNRVVLGPNVSANATFTSSAYCGQTAGGSNVTTYAP